VHCLQASTSTCRKCVKTKNFVFSLDTSDNHSRQTYVILEPLPGLSSDPPRHREYRGGWRRQGSYDKSKLQKIVSFIEVKPLNFHHSTHTYALFAVLLFPKCPVNNPFASNVRYPVGQRTSIL